ncbi:MAG: ATP-binding cassette domain-containing protein, partial [Clostridium sp.]|nr:ATP-binding cassette domain-containing protein [Clostridium sp.]
MACIKISNLTKEYGKYKVLDNVSLTIEENKIYGLLGRNGAGKTTLLNLITNRIFQTEGTITIDDENVVENG